MPKMTKKGHTQNPWALHDERGDTSRFLEWWATEAFFTTQEDKKRWSLKVAFSEGFVESKRRGVVCNMTLFDQDTNKQYIYYLRTPGAHLQSNSETFDVHYDDSYMKGSYPTYQMHFHDRDHEIEIDVTSHAESFPHWVAQDVTHGWLPMGVGFYRYGFIPRTRISGTLKIQGKAFTIQGDGFFEHVYGSFDYEHPLATLSGFLKTIWVYKKLIIWWLQNHTLKIPKTLTLSTENNPLGYDWVWALFDNSWSLFYGNAMFWIADGPAAGTLILTKDGKNYTEFSDITFHYTKVISAKDHDFCYPSELQIVAKKGKEALHLTCTMTGESREYVRSPREHKFWTGLAICEAPGVVKGIYDDGKQTIPLQGVCKIEPQRELSILGHNQLRIDFVVPPNGVGISLDFESHFFKKRIVASLQLAPHPKIRLNMQRISQVLNQ
jgi:hypothetical protein